MDKVTRIGVSLEPELLNNFDNYISRKGYPTRSEAIREVINEVLAKEMIDESSAHAVGTIVLLYKHNKSCVNQSLMDVVSIFIMRSFLQYIFIWTLRNALR